MLTEKIATSGEEWTIWLPQERRMVMGRNKTNDWMLDLPYYCT
jgi:hypothetical protein